MSALIYNTIIKYLAQVETKVMRSVKSYGSSAKTP